MARSALGDLLTLERSIQELSDYVRTQQARVDYLIEQGEDAWDESLTLVNLHGALEALEILCSQRREALLDAGRAAPLDENETH